MLEAGLDAAATTHERTLEVMRKVSPTRSPRQGGGSEGVGGGERDGVRDGVGGGDGRGGRGDRIVTSNSTLSSKSQGALEALAAAHEQTTRVLEAAARDKERDASPALRRGPTPMKPRDLKSAGV